jgi:hypothetical protein
LVMTLKNQSPALLARCGAPEAVPFITNAPKSKPCCVDTQVRVETSASFREPPALVTGFESSSFDLGDWHDHAHEHDDADLVPSPFDYGSLDSDTVASIRATAETIRKRMKHSIVATGRDLIKVKAKLEHGTFGRWLEAEFEMTVRTAQNYMRAADLADSKSETVSFLPATALFRLAAPSTPEAARDDVIARLERGEHVTATGINTLIRFARSEAALERKHKIITENRRWKRLLKKRGPSQLKLARLKLESEQRLAEQAAAQEAVALLRSRLGADFERFIDLWNRSGLRFSGALRNTGRSLESHASILIDEPVACLADEARP